MLRGLVGVIWYAVEGLYVGQMVKIMLRCIFGHKVSGLVRLEASPKLTPTRSPLRSGTIGSLPSATHQAELQLSSFSLSSLPGCKLSPSDAFCTAFVSAIPSASKRLSSRRFLSSGRHTHCTPALIICTTGSSSLSSLLCPASSPSTSTPGQLSAQSSTLPFSDGAPTSGFTSLEGRSPGSRSSRPASPHPRQRLGRSSVV